MGRRTVGMVGGGQLARMTHQAAIALDVELLVLAASAADPVAQVSPTILLGEPDAAGLEALAGRSDVVTFDHEGVHPGLLAGLERAGHLVRPGPFTLGFAVDKLAQRRHLAAAGLAVPAFGEVRATDHPDERAAAVGRFAADHGWPVVVKTPRGGYDGRGVWMVADDREARDVVEAVTGPLLVEEAVPIATEVAVVIARRPGGEYVEYPVAETVQVDGICHRVVAPGRLAPAVAEEALDVAHRVADAVESVGILAVELFVTDAGDVVVNEIAARPHNSGHLTIEGSSTSQFENHLRAVLDWPLGPAAPTAPVAVMANVLAVDDTTDPVAALPRVLELGPVHVHLYGKPARPGRKIGHVTVLGDDVTGVEALARRAAAELAAPCPAHQGDRDDR